MRPDSRNGAPKPLVTSTCANCQEPLSGPYCASCGEKEGHRISFGSVASDLREQLLGLNSRWVRTLRELLISPGPMIRSYLEGRRRPYTSPLKALFLTATVYLAAITLLDIQVAAAPRAQASATLAIAFVNYLIFLFLVPAAAWLRWLHRRSGLHWAECYVVLCYLWTGYLTIATLLAVGLAAFDRYYLAVRTTAGLIYLTLGLKSLFRSSWLEGTLKGVAFYAGYFVITMVLMIALISLAHLTGFDALALPIAGR